MKVGNDKSRRDFIKQTAIVGAGLFNIYKFICEGARDE